MLMVEEYNQKESAAAIALPNRVLEMVNPVVFAAEGYPARVHSDSELWKYSCHARNAIRAGFRDFDTVAP